MPENVIRQFLIYYPLFLFSLSFHEMAHAWMAWKCGDDTARLQGRYTLNPLAHIDPIGTVLLPIVALINTYNIPIFGWAKPVPINPLRFKGWRKDIIKVSAAGPISNLILALIFSLILRATYQLHVSEDFDYYSYKILTQGIYLNLGLAFFNLIPLHPLDGGKVMENILQPPVRDFYNQIARYGMWILFAGYYFGIFQLIRMPVEFFANYLIP